MSDDLVKDVLKKFEQERYDPAKAKALRMQEKGSSSDVFDGDHEILFYMKKQRAKEIE